MSSSGDSSVSYLCPQCQTVLTAEAADAGKRRECPQCGKLVKVPGTPTSSAPNRPVSQTGGIADIPVVCPLCGTRLHATKDQIGQPIVCPDCLESVVVPDLAPPRRAPREPAGPGPPAEPDKRPEPSGPEPPPVASTATPGSAEDDYQLSEPVELPQHRSVTRKMADLLDQVTADPGAHKTPPPPPRREVPPQFAIKCPICDTMLQATAEEIGTSRACPDCYSQVVVTAPRPKARRVNEVVVSDYANDDYKLSDPVDMDVYHPSASDVAPRTVGEEALRNARLAQAERERETPQLPINPLVTGVFAFLSGATITRLAVSGLLIGFCAWLLATIIHLINGPPGQWLAALVLCVVWLLAFVTTASLTAINLLTVLLESAEGNAEVAVWPENSLAEWIMDSMPLLMAAFFASGPGILFTLTWSSSGMPASTAWIFTGFSFYALFPVAQLSILETASLSNPFSPPIIASLRAQFLLWATFYIETFFLGLAVAFVITSLLNKPGLPLSLLLGLCLASGAFVYCRLLGRLAWACQMGPNRTEKKRKKEGKSEREEKQP